MLRATKIEEVMTKSIFAVDIEDTIHKADEIMRNEKLRYIPILDNKKFIGMITEQKLLEYNLQKLYDFDDEFGEAGYDKIIDFRNIMQKNVHIIYPEDSLYKAIELMAKKKINFLPVIDWKNNLVGIVSSSDLFLFILDNS